MVIYLGNKYLIRNIFAKYYAKINHAKYKKDCFESANGYVPELNFKKEENQKILKYLPKNNKKIIAVNIESKDKKRCWSSKKYLKLIKKLDKKYNIILLGVDPNYNKIITHNTNIISLVGKLNIRESALLIKNSNLYVGNDSGLIHISYALKTPVIMILNYESIKKYKILAKTKIKLLNNPPIPNVLNQIDAILK